MCLANVPRRGLDAEASVLNMRAPHLHLPEETLLSLLSVCTNSFGSVFFFFNLQALYTLVTLVLALALDL